MSSGGAGRASTPVHTRPVHVEIRPRDNYQHHVPVESAGDVISWSFFTRRKNVAFGLFYLYTAPVPAATPDVSLSPDSPLKSLARSTSNTSLRPAASKDSVASRLSHSHTPQQAPYGDAERAAIRQSIQASRSAVCIEPAAKPKAGQGSVSVRSSRTGSLQGGPMLGENDSRSEMELSRSRTTGNRSLSAAAASSSCSSHPLDAATLKLNTSLPDLRELASPVSISGLNATEYLEVLAVERYESFERTIAGHYTAPIAGTYVLYFDNSYSINTSKELFLTVAVGPAAAAGTNGNGNGNGEGFCGWLLKKKQRRLQGWARRWFQLDHKGTLSYFEDRFSPCRGFVDVPECTITKIPHRLMITVDSGAETFHLRALSPADYERWSDQLSAVRAQSAMQGLAIASGPAGTHASGAAILSYSERIAASLEASERLLANLRALADREDDGQIKFLAPLGTAGARAAADRAVEQTFHSLAALHGTLSEYAVFLQRAGQRMSLVPADWGASPRSPLDESADEFYDAEEIIITDFSESGGGSSDEQYQSASREATSVGPSDDQSDFFKVLNDLTYPAAPLPYSASSAAGFRRRMPCLAPPCTVSFSSILRKSIGKDWSAIAVPVALNEPLSALQRLCEELEYSELLDQAAAAPSPLDRMALVAAFAVSAYAATVHRAERKPFTPILGETFEYERVDRGFRFVAEKVCHRPLVMACHAQSSAWSFWQDQRVKSKFWGKSMEYIPLGSVHVLFPDTGDHFVWNKVVTCVRNLLSGSKWVENYGDMAMHNRRTGDTAKITFRSNSGRFFATSHTLANEVCATIEPSPTGPDRDRERIVLRGRWDSILCRDVPGGAPQVIWKASPVPNDHAEYFGFTEFAITLNDTPSHLRGLLPPTDSRLRPDQRMLEEGRVGEAEEEKQRIEQAQRESRQSLEERGDAWTPRWFRLEAGTADDPEGSWTVIDPESYWQCRQGGEWPAVPRLW